LYHRHGVPRPSDCLAIVFSCDNAETKYFGEQIAKYVLKL
jgi:hypothetical protein